MAESIVDKYGRTLVRTPRTKTCPRCYRVGIVALDPGSRRDECEILWPARADRGPDVESGVSESELSDPNFGCGYDDAAAIAAAKARRH
jgi:hypothetical protein